MMMSKITEEEIIIHKIDPDVVSTRSTVTYKFCGITMHSITKNVTSILEEVQEGKVDKSKLTKIKGFTSAK